MIKLVRRSLRKLLGQEYMDAVVKSAYRLGYICKKDAEKLADTAIDFYPAALSEKLDSMLPEVGRQIANALSGSAAGAGTRSYANATHNNTRGQITRFLEQELIRTANGIPCGDSALQKILSSQGPGVLPAARDEHLFFLSLIRETLAQIVEGNGQ